MEQTLDFALDVRATEYLETGVLGSQSWPEAIRGYRTRLRNVRNSEGIAAFGEELAGVRQTLGVVAVSCDHAS